MIKYIIKSTYKTYHGKIGYFFLLLLIIGNLIHSWLLGNIWPESIYDPIVGFDLQVFPHPTTPSKAHLLGTDPLGRDVLSMFLAGSGPLIKLSIFSFFIGISISLFLGTTIPFIFKRTDLIFKEIPSGLILISPPIILLILGTGDFTDILTPSSVGIIYGILSGLGVCYLVVRSAVIEISNQEFINASKLLGGKNLYIATRHIMPVVVPYAVSYMLASTTYGILAYGFASFYGQVGWTPNWGMMIYDAITYGSYLGGTNYWNLIPPTLGFTLCASSFYFLSLSVKKQFGISI